MPFFFISCTFSGVYPCACIHCRANRTGEYQKAPSTKVRSAATRMATMFTLAVGMRLTSCSRSAALRTERAVHDRGPTLGRPHLERAVERVAVEPARGDRHDVAVRGRALVRPDLVHQGRVADLARPHGDWRSLDLREHERAAERSI